MVGDQCQLPATVLSQEAQSKGLDISMFDRAWFARMDVYIYIYKYTRTDKTTLQHHTSVTSVYTIHI